MARAAADRDGPLGQALAKIVAVTVEDYFRKIVDTVLGRRGDLARMMALHEGDPDWTRCEERCLKRLFGLDEEVSEAELTTQLADVLANSDIDALLAALEVNGAESRTDQELRDGLQAARAASGGARVAALRPIFLTDKHTPRRSVCSKTLRQAEPRLCAALDIARKAASTGSRPNARSLLAPRRARRCFCSPTRSRPNMSGASRARRCSTMTT